MPETSKREVFFYGLALSMALGRLARPPSCRPLHGSNSTPKHAVPSLSLQSRVQLLQRRLHSLRARHHRWQAQKAEVEVQQQAELRAAAEVTAAESSPSAAGGAVPQDEVERSRRHIKEEQRRLADSHAEPYDLAKTRVSRVCSAWDVSQALCAFPFPCLPRLLGCCFLYTCTPWSVWKVQLSP